VDVKEIRKKEIMECWKNGKMEEWENSINPKNPSNPSNPSNPKNPSNPMNSSNPSNSINPTNPFIRESASRKAKGRKA